MDQINFFNFSTVESIRNAVHKEFTELEERLCIRAQNNQKGLDDTLIPIQINKQNPPNFPNTLRELEDLTNHEQIDPIIQFYGLIVRIDAPMSEKQLALKAFLGVYN